MSGADAAAILEKGASAIDDPLSVSVTKTADVVAIAKAFVAGAITSTTLTKRDFREAIVAGGEALQKRHSELTPEQARVRFMANNPDGRALREAEKIAPDADVKGAAPIPQEQTEAYKQLVALARELASREPGLSYAAAYQRVFASPQGQKLYAEMRAQSLMWSQVATGQARAVTPAPRSGGPGGRNDGIGADRNRYPNGDAATYHDGYARYKAAVNDLRKSGLSHSEAIFKIQRDSPDVWAAAKAA